ncbi:MAG: hypothetical protein ACE364_06520 [Chlorobiota bacterium]
MKKAILILLTLLVASVFYYTYKSEQLLNNAIHSEVRGNFDKAIDYYYEYSEWTNNNIICANKLHDLAEVSMSEFTFYDFEDSFNKFDSLELKFGWFNDVDSNAVNEINFKKSRLYKHKIEIYINTGRYQEAYDLLIKNEDDYFPKDGCGTGYLGVVADFYNKLFLLNFRLRNYDESFDILSSKWNWLSREFKLEIKKLIRWKMYQFSSPQQDSIINSAYNSVRYEISENNDKLYYTMIFDVFGYQLPGEYSGRTLNELSFNYTKADSNKILEIARKEFIDSWFYETLVKSTFHYKPKQ